jgi:hypothetical protein
MRRDEMGFTGFTFCAQYWSMQNGNVPSGLGSVIALLAQHSKRPRYAFLVLQLIADSADVRGRAGPFVQHGDMLSTIRDWLALQLMPISSRDGRRDAMRLRVKASVSECLTGNAAADEALVEQAVEDQARIVGRQNVSRAISDLVRAGLLTRHYAGYATNHPNRGGGRHAVYDLSPLAMTALGMTVAETSSLQPRRSQALLRQLDMFCAVAPA